MMKTIADIMWDTMQGYWRDIVNAMCLKYENDPKYHLEKIFEAGELAGFFVWYDAEKYRMLEAGYYVGKNPFLALRMYRKMAKGAAVLRAFVQKPNERVWRTYLNMGFKIIGEDDNNYLLEKGC